VVSNKLSAVALFATFLVVSVALIVISPQNTYAGGGVGDGGGVGPSTGYCKTHDCSQVPHTANGYGWHRFGVNEPGPADLKNGGDWRDVADICRDSGNDSVIAFVIMRPGDDITSSRVYDYEADRYGFYDRYLGDNGDPWLSYATAQGYFNTLPAGAKTGYTFGSNVGWFCYDFAPKQWNIVGRSLIQKGTANFNAATVGTINAKPGERLNWYHDLRNVGPDNMDRQVYYMIAKTGFTNGWDAISDPSGYIGPANANANLMTNYATNGGANTVHTVTQADVGNSLCQRVNWQAASWQNPGVGTSSFACATIPYSYALVPEISNITDGAMVESAAGSIPVSARVINTGETRSHPNIQWQVTQVKYAPGATINNKAGGVNGNNPCAYFTGNLQCGPTTDGSGTQAPGYAYRETVAYSAPGNLGDEPGGTRICFAMSIKRNSSTSTEWRHSQLYCLSVGKKPKVQVLGSDLIVGRGSGVSSNVVTSNSRMASGNVFGSWAEYGIVASGTVARMASGSGYANGSVAATLCSLSVLTFSNTATSGSCNENTIGRYTTPNIPSTIAARYLTSDSTPDLKGSVAIGGLSGLYQSTSGSLTVLGGDIPAKRWVVINAPNTTVTISNNITYTTGVISNIHDIPQVVIIAKNIIISDEVTNLDAWLVASGAGVDGRINTCGAGSVTETSPLTISVCDKRLTVNGPISTDHLIMRRTAGAGVGAEAGEPAEVFNLRADAYLWAAAHSGDTTSRMVTVSTKELPPRF
jgi:hypothetical protein